MKKFFVFLFSFVFIGLAFAAGENIPTSKSYVDAEVAEKQNKISANNGGAQVLTNTGTAGEYGTKDIYNSSNAYAGQSDALIDAQTMNTAVQNAIDSEFECVDNDCTLFNVSANERSGVFSGEKFTTDNQQVGYIMSVGGVISTNSNYNVTDYIFLRAGAYTVTFQDTSTSTSRPFRILRYDLDKNFIDAWLVASSKTNLQTFNLTLDTDSYVRVSYRKTDFNISISPTEPIIDNTIYIPSGQ